MRLNKVGCALTVMFSIGLSIFSIIFIGVSLNGVGSLIGLDKPISLIPLTIVINLFTLLALIYLNIKGIRNQDFCLLQFDQKTLLYLFSFIVLPVISIFGIEMFNRFEDNRILIFVLLSLSIVPFVIVLRNEISHSLYPFIIFATSISLLYHKSLFSSYIFGTDIFREYALSNLVLVNSSWDSTINYPLNGMLSIVLLAPIYSIITNVSLIWVYKLVYPFIFSFVPVGIYILIQKQTTETIALLSSFLFIFTSSFYGILLEASRQQIAELFLILLLICMSSDSITPVQKNILLILFMAALVVSHYGLTYIFLILFIIYFLVHIFNFVFRNKSLNNVSFSYTLLFSFTIMALGWYIYTAQTCNFRTFVALIDLILQDLENPFDPNRVEALGIVAKNYSVTRQYTKYLYLIAQASILIGFISYLFGKTQFKFNNAYTILSGGYLVLLILSFIVPNSSAAMTTSRTYHTGLILLSCFFVIGITFIFNNLGHYNQNRNVSKSSLIIASIFLFLLLLFDSGLMCEMIKDEPANSLSLNTTVVHPPHFTPVELCGVNWFQKHKENFKIYCDLYTRQLLYSCLILNFISNNNQEGLIESDTINIDHSSYIFLSNLNVLHDKILIRNWVWNFMGDLEYPPFTKSVFYKSVILNSNKIYDSDRCEIFLSLK